MNPTNRDYFDQQVEWVLARLPQSILRLLKEVPLHVEDQPSKRLLKELKIKDADELCGFFSGVPKGEGNVIRTMLGSDLPILTSITVFRRGVIAASRDEWGKVRRSELREQIRITILHELAHLHGMDDEEIDEIGYG
jgi:predicted Zn-dependent protease with MMP-like domain